MTTTTKHDTRNGTLALLFATATWGSTFPLIKDAVENMPVADFLAIRFCIASALLLIIRPMAVKQLTAQERRYAYVLGALYGGGQLLQTIGLQYTSAATSGFVTGMYVVFTPLVAAVLLRRRPDGLTWVAVLLSTAGIAALSLKGMAIGSGEAITALSAVLYAMHIVALSAFSTTKNALGITALSLVVVAGFCSLAALPDGLADPGSGGTWASIIYTAVIPGALALLLQTWAQAHIAATRAAIIMTTEPVFAALFAILLVSEPLTWRLLLGGSLILAAMYLVELGPRHSQDATLTHGGPL